MASASASSKARDHPPGGLPTCADRPGGWKGGPGRGPPQRARAIPDRSAARGGCLAGVSAACACAAVRGTGAGMVGFVGAFPAEALSATASVLK
ncbi:hypothetical protein HMPREF1550_00985 [Actinomyces sp. oral taxon 877 str. F0543]|nr:hypothetical protein HMPREF1550_00985 [Actinomyces sp. oral taxon 877 str. F0543]